MHKIPRVRNVSKLRSTDLNDEGGVSSRDEFATLLLLLTNGLKKFCKRRAAEKNKQGNITKDQSEFQEFGCLNARVRHTYPILCYHHQRQ